MNQRKYFCNDCFYWFRLGGMMAHRNLKCPECQSGDVVRKDLSIHQQHFYSDKRENKRRDLPVSKQSPAEPLASHGIPRPHVIEAGIGSEEYSVQSEPISNKGLLKKIIGKL